MVVACNLISSWVCHTYSTWSFSGSIHCFPINSSLLFLLALVLYLPPIQPSGPPNLRSAGLLPTADCLGTHRHPPESSVPLNKCPRYRCSHPYSFELCLRIPSFPSLLPTPSIEDANVSFFQISSPVPDFFSQYFRHASLQSIGVSTYSFSVSKAHPSPTTLTSDMGYVLSKTTSLQGVRI